MIATRELGKTHTCFWSRVGWQVVIVQYVGDYILSRVSLSCSVCCQMSAVNQMDAILLEFHLAIGHIIHMPSVLQAGIGDHRCVVALLVAQIH